MRAGAMLLALVVLGACAAPVEPDGPTRETISEASRAECSGRWALVGTWTSEERAAIEAARDGWRRLGVHVELDDDAVCTISRGPIPEGAAADGSTGWCDVRGDLTIDADVLSLDDVRRIAMHEIGHGLGMQHIPPEIPAIMNHVISVEQPPRADWDECVRVGECDEK